MTNKSDGEKKIEYEVPITGKGIQAINEYLGKVVDKNNHKGINYRWFRGQANIDNNHKKDKADDKKLLKLLPGIFREKGYDEFWMTTTFRNRAPMFGETSPRDDMDKWLFLMKHVNLPTRLLDWTESPLFALYFAVKSAKEVDSEPVVWSLNPKALNYHSIYNYKGDDLSNENPISKLSIFPNTWKDTGPGIGNIRLAFRESHEKKCLFCFLREHGVAVWRFPKIDKKGCFRCRATKNPIAIQLTYCHPRMSAQKGCMTVHGTDSGALEDIVDPVFIKHRHLVKYIFKGSVDKIRNALHSAGITESVIYPDLLGLAEELKERFKKPSTDEAVNDADQHETKIV